MDECIEAWEERRKDLGAQGHVMEKTPALFDLFGNRLQNPPKLSPDSQSMPTHNTHTVVSRDRLTTRDLAIPLN